VPPATPDQEEVKAGKDRRPREEAGPGVAPPGETPFRILRMPQPAEADDSTPAQTAAAAPEETASNWFALQGVLRPARPRVTAAFSGIHPPAPALAFFSISGGTGKTSLTAALGRALAAHGEQVLLADLTGPGALPFYFGARDHRLGKMRTFSPPEGSGHAPVFLLSLEGNALLAQGEMERSIEELLRSKPGVRRILVDIPTAAEPLALSLLPLAPTILVPLLPDMNSILNLAPLESIFADRRDADRPPAVMYLLNKFDASLPLHLDVRELLQKQLGDRLLPFVIRRSPAVSEALAQGMTVIDYAPNTAVTQDYLRLATWLRSVSSLADTGLRGVRWSEQ
jgi:cellulose synthase operon protein YhjQ